MAADKRSATTEFSADWLRLREAADRRARNPAIAAGLSAAFATRAKIGVVDLGCGTGANLRATARLLGPTQDWTLIDNDRALLDRARVILCEWADMATPAEHGLRLAKDGKTILVRFRHADVGRDPAAALGDRVDLVTASAFFDLVSRAFIDLLVAAAAQRNAALYAVLSYNGVQLWSPAGAEDQRIVQAFNAHQGGDKGFGPASGPLGAAYLAGACAAAGYRVEDGDSPWRIGRDEAALLQALAAGAAAAVAETGLVDAASIAVWRARAWSGVVVGHTDVLALPVRRTA
jgi:hypothetical protein